MNIDPFKGQNPYPYPKNITKNAEYARIIKISYSGSASELTGISQYIYHHIRFKNIDEDIADSLEKIAIVEMTHFDMLGQLVEDLGLDPKYTMQNGLFQTYWDAGAVRYGRTPEEMLRYDADAEKEAISFYKRTISMIPDEEIQALIERIIEDEEMHLRWFTKTYDELLKKTGKSDNEV